MPITTSGLKPNTGLSVAVPFSIAPTLYAVTSGQTITFTPCGATGRMGPTLAQALSAYSGQHAFSDWGNNVDLFMVDLGVQYWTVPKSGSYRITAAGASGGPATGGQGYGAVLTSDFSLNAGDVLRIVVGQRGINGDGSHAGGGGASAVSVMKYGMMTLLIVGAGGAGVSSNDNSTGNRSSFRHARVNDSAGLFGSGNYPGKGSQYQNGYSTFLDYWYGGGGGCWGKDGMRGGIGYWHREKHPVQNEGKALDSVVPYGGTSHANHHGGFGGGGASGVGGGAGGGGGGYQGGNSQYINGNATVNDTGNTQGGGSYSLNALVSSSVGESGNNATGYVSIVLP